MINMIWTSSPRRILRLDKIVSKCSVTDSLDLSQTLFTPLIQDKTRQSCLVHVGGVKVLRRHTPKLKLHNKEATRITEMFTYTRQYWKLLNACISTNVNSLVSTWRTIIDVYFRLLVHVWRLELTPCMFICVNHQCSLSALERNCYSIK